jgi:hypothetical protein
MLIAPSIVNISHQLKGASKSFYKQVSKWEDYLLQSIEYHKKDFSSSNLNVKKFNFQGKNLFENLLEDYGDETAVLYGTPDQTGTYPIELKTADGMTEEFQSFDIVVDLTNTNELNIKNTLIYPNPFHNKVLIENCTGSGFTIFSSSGTQIIDKYIPENIYILDLSTLIPGIYFCRIKNGNEIITKKIIKMK